MAEPTSYDTVSFDEPLTSANFTSRTKLPKPKKRVIPCAHCKHRRLKVSGEFFLINEHRHKFHLQCVKQGDGPCDVCQESKIDCLHPADDKIVSILDSKPLKQFLIALHSIPHA